MPVDAPQPGVPETSSARIRLFDVAAGPELQISPEPIVRPAAGARGPLDTDNLMLTLTTRAEYAFRPRVGKGRAERAAEPVVVPAKQVHRWMKLETVLAMHATSGAKRVAPSAGEAGDPPADPVTG